MLLKEFIKMVPFGTKLILFYKHGRYKIKLNTAEEGLKEGIYGQEIIQSIHIYNDSFYLVMKGLKKNEI